LHTPAPGLTTGPEAPPPPSQSWPTKTEIYLEAHTDMTGECCRLGHRRKYSLEKMSLLFKNIACATQKINLCLIMPG
jgi:hypothetical protein